MTLHCQLVPIGEPRVCPSLEDNTRIHRAPFCTYRILGQSGRSRLPLVAMSSRRVRLPGRGRGGSSRVMTGDSETKRDRRAEALCGIVWVDSFSHPRSFREALTASPASSPCNAKSKQAIPACPRQHIPPPPCATTCLVCNMCQHRRLVGQCWVLGFWA